MKKTITIKLALYDIDDQDNLINPSTEELEEIRDIIANYGEVCGYSIASVEITEDE